MSFTGSAPEILNGRLAMLGMCVCSVMYSCVLRDVLAMLGLYMSVYYSL